MTKIPIAPSSAHKNHGAVVFKPSAPLLENEESPERPSLSYLFQRVDEHELTTAKESSVLLTGQSPSPPK